MAQQYHIYDLGPAGFQCHARVQDGWEEWNKPTLDIAVFSLVKFAKNVNHEKIRRKDICLFRSKEVVKTEWELCKLD